MNIAGTMMVATLGAVLGSVVFSSFCSADYTPGRTLEDDLVSVQVRTIEGYRQRRPRLLFFAEDGADIRQRAAANTELWQQVLDQTKGLRSYVPDEDEVRTGRRYWRIPRILSGALAYFVTGDQSHKDAAMKWMVAHCEVDVWGDSYRPNVDLQAAWFLYYISLAYDILHPDLTDSERAVIREGLTDHARAIYESLQPPQQFRYDQNHTYIPASALAAAACALLGEVPEADQWLRHAYAMMRRCRYVLGEDGYYYEGSGYWSYALHWHERYARMLARATGEPTFDLPILRNNYLYALHVTLPGQPFLFDMGDTGRGSLGRPSSFSINRLTMLYGLASAFHDGRSMAVADRLAAMGSGADDPAMYFLRYDPRVKPARINDLPTYHHFTDHDVVFWRSSWGEDATCYMFRCGPPQGHLAARKLEQMDDWTMNSGHVHPDIGMFWIYAKGQYLAADTGYTAAKRTDDHNTLLVDGIGQGVDGSYWVYRGWPYSLFDAVRMEKVHLDKDYGYAMGDLSPAYPQDTLGELSMKRHVLMTERYLIVLDEIEAEREHTYTWLLHADETIESEGDLMVSQVGDARLLTYVLAPKDVAARVEPTMVNAGTAPGPGEPEQRGYQLAVENAAKAKRARFLTVLIPAAGAEKNPLRVSATRVDAEAVEVEIAWTDADVETVAVDLSWQMSREPANRGPAVFKRAE